MNNFVNRVEHDGFAIIEGVLNKQSVSGLIEALLPIQEQACQVSGGVRNLMRLSPLVENLAKSEAIHKLVAPILGPDSFPVRAILFDKTPDTNWKIPWHQDVTIAVKEKIACEGYGPWSTKAGVLHVQPPAEISEQMLSVRLHLDDCPESNGALRVIPRTHKLGKLCHMQTGELTAMRQQMTCEVEAGGVLLMRPLLLHASSEAKGIGHRRVIHIDYAATRLACGLEWDEARDR